MKANNAEGLYIDRYALGETHCCLVIFSSPKAMLNIISTNYSLHARGYRRYFFQI